MLRADFEAHPLWATIEETEQQCHAILASGEPLDIPRIEVVQIVMSHFRSYHRQRNRIAVLFAEVMLEDVAAAWRPVEQSLLQRSQYEDPAYSASAQSYAEAALVAKAAWPQLHASPRAEAGDQTLFEDLLEAQRLSVESLKIAHTTLARQIESYETAIDEKAEEVSAALTSYGSNAAVVNQEVDAQKARVDEVVTRGVDRIAALEKLNTERYDEWIKNRATSFSKEFAPLQNEIKLKVKEAQASLESLRTAVAEYANLSTAAAAETLATEYEREAGRSRRWGGALYGVGIFLLTIGGLPLILSLLADNSDATGDELWTELAVRLAIGALAASAATVAIRLGARLIHEAGSVKRMALELRTIGPFLANVSDRDNVDNVRLQLIDRTFGHSYAPTSVVKDKDEEVVNVTAVSQLLGAVGKMMSRN